MARGVRLITDALYWTCVVLASASLVLISVVIPYSVYTRYVLNRAASWPEPAAILLTLVLTFFGAAVCYRDGMHMRVQFFTSLMPPLLQRLCGFVAEGLSAAVCVFMIVWGYGLCEATWHDVVAEFPSVSVGITYLPIPLGGAATLVFVLERMITGLGRQEPVPPASFD